MSSRRSARLSAASLQVKESSVPEKPSKKVNTSRKRKNTGAEAVPSSDDQTSGPSTPKRKRATLPVPPPMTPTPSAIGLLAAPVTSRDMAPPPINRLAFPNGTNATLVTPETHRVLANKPVDQVSPSKTSKVKTTSENILDEGVAHLIKVEPKLKLVIEKHPCHMFSPEGLAEEIDPFMSLTSGIISQQVSGAAAKSIKAKFVALFNTNEPDVALHKFPTPSQVCSSKIEILRTAGLSQRKAEYVLGLAEKFHKGELTTAMLFTASYEEVLEELIKVRGLGKWSVEMFACFGLKRMDVFSTGDLGVQRGMAVLAGRNVSKLKASKAGKWKYMGEKEMEEMAEKFRPYRSLLMYYSWRVEDVDISSLGS
ncbi:3-methyladenine DNA glycosylase [Cadophora gregata]|uniref:3-methyladenine DNA glycosylase n=1 Tax=Cadophora gregata TaxID=51156 RepID=UPI0026DB5477|nr:3-methyladenine DNA glycosylase [Cadophora gregata]KAK0107101.1 3-methyladenine DNA glycosylase [Cadophora gregata]KAK0116786.1 3-methyladenine DNA glycosylase [Cadophora gregata f. sp. sojae]